MTEPRMGAIIGAFDRTWVRVGVGVGVGARTTGEGGRTIAILEVTASRRARGSTSRRIAWRRMRLGLGLGLESRLGSRE
eukprot:scaffold33105_cov63-Phaeocystis_antarctica.AAC.2